jgi:hypothetical protein
VPRLTWSAVGERFYEIGVDRGVLYVGNQPGVPWPGLIAVSENVSGGAAKPYYLDGIKYLNLATAEEFEATLEAFFSPPEFGPCDGVATIQNGLFATQQNRSQFNLCYRTKVGNDIDGPDHAYKIHIVYNALATPSQRAYKTIGSSMSPDTLNWTVTTQGIANLGYKPTAHFVIDSRYTLPFRLNAIEDILYGSDIATPILPSAQDLLNLFADDAFPPLKAVSIGANVYEIHEVDQTNARAVASRFHPVPPAVGEDPILWFDTSSGDHAVPTLVTGG